MPSLKVPEVLPLEVPEETTYSPCEETAFRLVDGGDEYLSLSDTFPDGQTAKNNTGWVPPSGPQNLRWYLVDQLPAIAAIVGGNEVETFHLGLREKPFLGEDCTANAVVYLDQLNRKS